MTGLPDSVFDHLRTALAEPDLTGTRYELRGRLGEGGSGVVWEASDTQLGRSVALKVQATANERLAARLLEEARLVARLEHPGIVPLYDAGVLADGRVYIAMKRVEGPRLDDYVRRQPSLSDRLRVFLQICDAVAFAHSEGVVHRDLKPGNIMVGAFGQVQVMDWGVARVEGEFATLGVVGTRPYMAPEQEAAQPAGPAADVFALGRILAEMAAPELPKPVRAIAARASAVRAEDRYASVGDLTGDVRRFLDREPVSAYRESWPERAARFWIRNQVLLGLLAAYIIVRLLLFFFRPA